MPELEKDIDDLLDIESDEDRNIDEGQLAGDFGPAPEGQYHVEVDDVEVKENSKGTGYLLKVELKNLVPEKFGDTKFFYQMNIRHTNKEVEQIGQKEFDRLCVACGRSMRPTSFADLIGDECFVTIRHREYEWEGEMKISEDVKKVSKVDGSPEGPFDDQPDHSDGDVNSADDEFGDDFDDDDLPF